MDDDPFILPLCRSGYHSGDHYSGGGDYYSGGGGYYSGEPDTACAILYLAYGPVDVAFTHQSDTITYHGKMSLVLGYQTIPEPENPDKHILDSPCDQHRPVFQPNILTLFLKKENDEEYY
jgi:hypothetical protein